MCGIVGYVGKVPAIQVIVPALQRLEYRGYDSAGVAIYDGKIRVVKKKGKVSELIPLLGDIRGNCGIGHTRWSTHGEPSDKNAHPHLDESGKLAIVHNGIIDDYLSLKKEVSKKHKIISDTDTELLAHIISDEIAKGKDILSASFVLKDISGSYAVAIIHEDFPMRIVLARRGSPLNIGIWKNIGYIASSDIPSLISFTREIIPLEDGEFAEINPEGWRIISPSGRYRKPIYISWDTHTAEKEGYKHFMLKEIFEEPRVIYDTAREMLSIWDELDFGRPKFINIFGCGTSYHAGLLGKIWIEEISGVPVSVEHSSEARYKNFGYEFVLAISQSGETADTLEAVREAKKRGAQIVSFVNVLGSSLHRESTKYIHTNAGIEVGVAATKTFMAQLVGLYLFSLKLAGENKNSKRVQDIFKTAEILEKNIVKFSERTEEVAEIISSFKNSIYLGRWISFPVALEGALKLKEISYIHAEGYPAGEMKHGPIALVDPSIFVLFIIPKDKTTEKILSNVQEIIARKGKVIIVSSESVETPKSLAKINFPDAPSEFLSPFISIVPLQLIAYHTANLLGHDVDQPRNLAKSVTVE